VFFEKTVFFREKLSGDFSSGGLMANSKNKVEKSPVRNIKNSVYTKNTCFLKNKPVGREIARICKKSKNPCFATAI
jgi:hypothetical protein